MNPRSDRPYPTEPAVNEPTQKPTVAPWRAMPDAEEQLSLLDELSTLLSNSYEVDTVYHLVARMLVPVLGDACMVIQSSERMPQEVLAVQYAVAEQAVAWPALEREDFLAMERCARMATDYRHDRIERIRTHGGRGIGQIVRRLIASCRSRRWLYRWRCAGVSWRARAGDYHVGTRLCTARPALCRRYWGDVSHCSWTMRCGIGPRRASVRSPNVPPIAWCNYSRSRLLWDCA